jgi:hypothetical protein
MSYTVDNCAQRIKKGGQRIVYMDKYNHTPRDIDAKGQIYMINGQRCS